MGDYHAFLLSYDLGRPNPLLFKLYREKKDLERGGGGIAIAAISEAERGTEKIRRQQKKEWVSSITTVLCRIGEVNRKALFNLHAIKCYVDIFVTEPGFQRNCKRVVCVRTCL